MPVFGLEEMMWSIVLTPADAPAVRYIECGSEGWPSRSKIVLCQFSEYKWCLHHIAFMGVKTNFQ